MKEKIQKIYYKYANYLLVALLGVILLVPLVVIFVHNQSNKAPFSLIVEQKAEGEHSLTLWRDDETWYAFLPSYAELQNVQFKIPTRKLFLDDTVVKDGMSLDKIELKHSYACRDWLGRNSIHVVFLQSENLPSIYIDTQSGNMKYLEADKERKEKGNFLLVDTDGAGVISNELSWVSGRGNHTWDADKKGWSFKFSEQISLLGMGRNDKWVLLANAYDPSDGLRNYSAYKMAIESGLEYSSDLRFVDLYLNSDYFGTYQLVEKIDEGLERLNIGDLDTANAEANPLLKIDKNDMPKTKIKDSNGQIIRIWSNINSPEDISGGYIVERNYGEKLEDKDYRFVTEGGEGFVIRYPEVVTKEESNYIYEHFQQLENLLFSDTIAEESKDNLLKDYIDLDSWIKKYLVDEITKNESAGATSSFFYKKRGDDLIYAGPVWDYDKSLGTKFYDDWYDPENLTYCSWHSYRSMWWKQLYNSPEAFKRIRQYYSEIFRPYLNRLVSIYLDEWAEEISASYQMDWIRWGKHYMQFESYQGKETDIPGDLSCSVSFLKDWISARVSFLDKVWIDTGETLSTNQTTSEKKETDVSNDGADEYNTINKMNQIVEWVVMHKRMILLFTLVAVMGLCGIFLLYAEIQRNWKGELDSE